MSHVTVYPTKASALNVKHPHGPKMALGGVPWPKDGFTGRMISDRIVTEDKARAYKPEPESVPAAPPVAATSETPPAPAPASMVVEAATPVVEATSPPPEPAVAEPIKGSMPAVRDGKSI